jgi:hypothetical protein
MPKPPNGQSPKKTVTKQNAAKGPKAFHQNEYSGFAASTGVVEGSLWRLPLADFRANQGHTTPKQIQKAFPVSQTGARTRSITQRKNRSPFI